VEGEIGKERAPKVGWVTLLKDGKKLVTSKQVRQSAGGRQLNASAWARRVAMDRAASKAMKESHGLDAPNPKGGVPPVGALKVELELAADPHGIGFAFGGVYPGTLHAKGRIVESHKVSYSIGIVGEYLLHVRLRQLAVPLPGSPFCLNVFPNVAHAGSTKLPRGECDAWAVSGLVGMGVEAGCGLTIWTYDLMGNLCIRGGANVTGNMHESKAAREKRLTSTSGADKGEVLAATVKDNDDGSYYLHWRCNYSGTYQVAIKINQEHVGGSPTSIKLMPIAPQLSKTDVAGDGLRMGVAGEPSRFTLRFFDQFDNKATPAEDFELGLALLKEKSFKDVSESHEFTMVPLDEEKSFYEVSFTPKVEGSFTLHVWAEDLGHRNEKRERMPLNGSPWGFAVAAGPASPERSFVDGWSKESKALDKHGKALDQRADLITAGDSMMLRPIICDALGNNTVPEDGALDLHIVLPDGSILQADNSSLKLIISTKGGVTTYDIRHEATRSGLHEVHILLNRTPIRGSPVTVDVATALPDVKSAKLFPPTEPALYSNSTYAIVLKTYDRFGNAIRTGGLAVATRLQIVKAAANDLTTLVPNNHSVEIEDNEDGTYHINVSLINLAATVKAVINMDKNIPASGGELPAVQLTFVNNPLSDKERESDKEPVEGARAPAAASMEQVKSSQVKPADPIETVVDSGPPPVVSTATPPISDQGRLSRHGSRNANGQREASREGSRCASPVPPPRDAPPPPRDESGAAQAGAASGSAVAADGGAGAEAAEAATDEPV